MFSAELRRHVGERPKPGRRPRIEFAITTSKT
jgi:hypothetical protein